MIETISHNSELASLRLRDLIVFNALYETRSLTQVSTELNIPVPSAGRILNKLREALRDPLFTRGGNGLVPTDKAIKLHDQIQEIIKLYERIDNGDVFDPLSLKKTFNIGIADNSVAEIIPSIIPKLHNTAPHVSLSLKTIDCTMFDRLKSGELDCAILADIPLPDDSFHKMSISKGACALYVRKGHNLDKKHSQGEPVTVEDVDQYRQIKITLRPIKGRLFGSIDQGLFHHLGNRNTAIELPYFLSAIKLLEATDLTLVLSKQTGDAASKHHNIVEIPISNVPDSQFAFILVWHVRSNYDPANQFLRGTIINAMKHIN